MGGENVEGGISILFMCKVRRANGYWVMDFWNLNKVCINYNTVEREREREREPTREIKINKEVCKGTCV